MREIFRWPITIVLYTWAGLLGFILIVTILLAAILMPFGSYEGLLMYGCRIYLRLIGIWVVTAGKEDFDTEQTYLFMANHVNLFDIFILGGYVPPIKRGVEAAEHFSWPLWGWLVKRVGNIPIWRQKLDEAKKSLNAAEEAVKKDISIVILPEGHRTRTGAFQEFKKGPFHLAKRAGVPIMPMGMSGLWEIKQFKVWHWRPGKVMVRYGKPIDIETIEGFTVEELRDKVRDAVGVLIDYDETPRREFAQ